jgi:predicted dehydrogenase
MAEKAMTINLRWVNKDRVPSPGSWFTTKELAYGGVSRDLMPHLLSLFAELDPNFYHATNKKVTVDQRWKLSDLLNTEYGKVDPNGVCNVDDFCYLEYENNNRRWLLTADWRSLGKDVRHIQFIYPDDTYDIVELGLCPEDAYQNMIQSALDHVYDADFWRKQLNCDLWIHEQIEKL